ncbi:MAG TPA: efflux RND transporter permease subunit [Candidatus Acidoferrum sp.]|nr:efflux RND transporter permease subunit [Candidatus Acidoferrum sp.]
MNVAEPFIRRPVMTTLFMAAILLFGIIAYRALPVSDLPNVDRPTIQVFATLPGASPDTMASAVATPLEKQFSTIAGIDAMTSTSTQGFSTVSLQFDLSRNIDAAAQDVQAAISRAAPLLPQNMPSPPTFQKTNPADQPILYMSVSSPTMPLSQVDEYAETNLSERISMIKGVAQVTVYGSQKYAVRIQVDPRALASRKIGLDEVSAAVQQGNVNLPTGTLSGAHKAFTVQANGQLLRADGYRPLIVAYRNGLPVRLGDLGVVADSVEGNRVASWYNNEPSIVLAIQRQPGTNTIEVVDAIKRVLPVIRQQIPPSVSLTVLYDRSESIRASVADVKFSLMLAVCLVVLVIFLFLRNLSATLIPSIALPMSIIGTFAVMYLLDYTVDNLSLMALTLSVGFVVDDAIVMLENIVRHMEHGEGVMEAALKGSREIGFTIVSMTLSLAAVFIPVLFMGGILGRLLHEFSVVIMVAILVSGVVSLSLTPMLCSRFLRPPGQLRHGRAYMKLEGFFDGMLRLYDRTLGWVLRHRGATMLVSAAILIATLWQFVVMPKGFLPSEDSGQIFAITLAQQGISFDAMKEHQQALNEVTLRDPNVDKFFSFCGASGFLGAGNTGILFLRLKAHDERQWIGNESFHRLEQRWGRKPVLGALLAIIGPFFGHHLTVEELIEELRPKYAAVPGILAFMQNPPPIEIGGHLTKAEYQFTLQSPNTQELYPASNFLLAKLRELRGLQDVNSDLQISNPQVNVEVNRDRAATLGLSAQQLEDALFTAYGQRQISTIYTPNNEYRVILELEDSFQRDPASLNLLYVRNATGQLVPLSSAADLTTGLGPLVVNHLGQLPAVTISFNLKPGTSLSEALDSVQKLARETLPSTVSTSFQGSAQAFSQSEGGLAVLLIVAVLVIYIVLGILYESFLHPLTILSGLPSAGFGALLTLWLFHYELNLYGFVGIIMLIGIVKKNAIMVVDFALEAQRSGGKSAAEAAHQGSLVRFRPIMMTTMAALMGTLPIALGVGAGAGSRRPLGLAVVGGLLFSQLVTLYLTPVFYTYVDAFQSRFAGKSRKSVTRPAAVPGTSVSAD